MQYEGSDGEETVHWNAQATSSSASSAPAEQEAAGGEQRGRDDTVSQLDQLPVGRENGEFFSGAILADEMGLGKTITSIAVISAMSKYELGCKSLIVCPSSLVDNWKKVGLTLYATVAVCVF